MLRIPHARSFILRSRIVPTIAMVLAFTLLTACGDTCSGEVGAGVLVCESQGGAPAACIVGCAEGTASCGGDPFDGCPIFKADTDYFYFQDADGDGFGDILLGAQFFCTPEEAAATLTNPIAYGAHPLVAGELELDCDDGSNATYPGAPELCNGVNNSCNGVPNDTDPTVVGVGDGARGVAGDLTGRAGGGGIASAQRASTTTHGDLGISGSDISLACHVNLTGLSESANWGSGGGGAHVRSLGVIVGGSLTTEWIGASGGGGAQPGLPGAGGVAGAPSIGFALLSSGTSAIMQDVEFTGGSAGRGGDGGDGGDGGLGGPAGVGTSLSNPLITNLGGQGGHGAGGNGGNGGNGGVSIGLLLHDSTIATLTNPSFNAGTGGQPGQPGAAGAGPGTTEIWAGEDGNPGLPGNTGLSCNRFIQAQSNGGTTYPITFRQSGCIN